MDTTINNKYNILELGQLETVDGGRCTWKGLAKASIASGAGNGFRVGVKTGTWQGAVAGAAGGAIVGAVGYGATCWW